MPRLLHPPRRPPLLPPNAGVHGDTLRRQPPIRGALSAPQPALAAGVGAARRPGHADAVAAPAHRHAIAPRQDAHAGSAGDGRGQRGEQPAAEQRDDGGEEWGDGGASERQRGAGTEEARFE